MSKSSQAFRTIREVADWLDVAAHVLRFWESKFPQIKPVKRAGGRRYYRPADMELVGGIKVLLHDRGMTIRGVQKMIREDGIAVVSALSPPIDSMMTPDGAIDGEAAAWVQDAAADDAAPAEPELAATSTEPSDQPAPPIDPDCARQTPEEPDAEQVDAPQMADDTPELGQIIGRLAALAADPAKIEHLRPATKALVALRDRMRCYPPNSVP